MKPIIRVSATGLGKGNCGLAFNRRVVQGYTPPKLAARLVYGIAFHKFTDVCYKTDGNMVKAKEAAFKAFSLPKLEPKKDDAHLHDFNHLFRVCCDCWYGYIADDTNYTVLLDGDGKPLTEQTFDIPLYQGEVYDYNITGTMDKIGKITGGIFAIGDWKTTSSWDNRGYFKQYELARQLKLYRLATIMEAERNPESTMGRLGKEKNLGLFIDAIFLKAEQSAHTFKRSDILNPSLADIEEFKRGLIRWCKRFDQASTDGSVSERDGIVTGACESKWGKCEFWNVCAAPKAAEQVMLNANFIVNNWNPLDYNGLEDE